MYMAVQSTQHFIANIFVCVLNLHIHAYIICIYTYTHHTFYYIFADISHTSMIGITTRYYIPEVPHKAVAEVSK